jgi:FdrA protein
VDQLLARRQSGATAQDFRPRSLRAAVKQLPEAAWVLISTPGRHAAAVAHEALDLERNVFLYSDNVSLQDEVMLKRKARERGLLVMGPDCGTAIINGIGLGFANRVRQGHIGLVGASGTGLQAVTTRIHGLGFGITHAIGTGGRDLTSEVAGITSHQALDCLARDAATTVIVMISKPPSPDVAATLLAAAAGAAKPVVVNFIGYPAPARELGNLHFASGLEDAAQIAVAQLSSASIPEDGIAPPLTGFLRGLFSGGTLAYESLLALQTTLFPVFSNAPIRESQLLADPLHSQAHTIIDLGDEHFMVGRLHPMIDNDLRLRRLHQEAEDAEVGLIMLDVVLGEGAHPDPAGELAPAIHAILARRPNLEIVAVVIGTDVDVQGIDSQVERLRSAGATVFRGLAQAVEYVGGRLRTPIQSLPKPLPADILSRPVAAINVGLESFADSLRAQGASVVQLDWRPPAGGNDAMASVLAKMRK